MCSTSDVEVDPGRRDRACENVERHIAEHPCVARVSPEVPPSEPEVDLRRNTTRLPHHGSRPLLSELVAVPVEEDVHLLRNRLRSEELRIGTPEDRLGAAGAELEQARQATLRVREDHVVLGRISTVVVVEPRVHAPELRQTHRHVAVVVDDGDPESLAQAGRNATEMGKRNGEEDHGIGPLALDESLEMALPSGCHDAPDRLAREPIERGLHGLVLAATEVSVPLEPGEPTPQCCV